MGRTFTTSMDVEVAVQVVEQPNVAAKIGKNTHEEVTMESREHSAKY